MRQIDQKKCMNPVHLDRDRRAFALAQRGGWCHLGPMQVDTLILGAGAAGLFCAGRCGGKVLIVDHAKAAGEKIRISGGGRCNFTNLDVTPANYLGENPHFHKSALARYTQWDFIDLVSSYGIAWHEKTLGQLFCDNSAKDIIAMLQSEMAKAGAELWLQTDIGAVRHDGKFHVTLTRDGRAVTVTADNLVVATGGKSIPKMGATGLAYQIATQFGLELTDTRPALVPFTFSDARFAAISGVSAPVTMIAEDGPSFAENLLFTHRGLSGPAVLQVSSYWREGEMITTDLLPGVGLTEHLRAARQDAPRKSLTTILASHLPARLVDHLATELDLAGNIGEWSDARFDQLEQSLHRWQVKPTGSEGYRTAEVTLGGIRTDGLSSKTMQAKDVAGLYFIGECVDVTGWLGGYNFQWAWASAAAAAEAIASA